MQAEEFRSDAYIYPQCKVVEFTYIDRVLPSVHNLPNFKHKCWLLYKAVEISVLNFHRVELLSI